jgi:sulfite reductase (NADPH) hemoprotein beta-component
VVPQYSVLLGGGVAEDGARFGRLAGKVPARRVPEVVERLTTLYAAERRGGERPSDYFARAFERARQVIAPLELAEDADPAREDLVEPGTTGLFRPQAQEGECAA